MIFAGDRTVNVEDLALAACSTPATPEYVCSLKSAVRGFERQHISRVLQGFSNNKVATAEALGIGLSSLYRKMEELGIARNHCEASPSR
jgi:DNA-binding NtrC family response regulator